MIDREHDFPVTGQAAVIGIARGTVYFLRRSVSAPDRALTRRIDELHLELPFAGLWILCRLLAAVAA